MICLSWRYLWLLGALVCIGSNLSVVHDVRAQNVASYSDTISNSQPAAVANHTFAFTPRVAIDPGSVLTFTFPADFSVSSDDFGVRNVEMYVNGVRRNATSSVVSNTDGVSITSGAGGSISYELHTGQGIPTDATVEIRVGNHTSQSVLSETTFATTTGTTTTYLDAPPVTNSADVGTHVIDMEVTGSQEPLRAGFSIAVIRSVGTGNVDTTEDIPPFRFNPAPTSTVGGTTQFVEISLETDEFADCRYSDTEGISFGSMVNEFEETGLIFHSSIVPVVRGVVNRFYVRCIDDEGNFNTDDFLIVFTVQDEPTGTANTEGETSGDGSGTGDSGTGDGAGSGGTTGERDGEANTEGGSAGGGGSGGGGGGGSGSDSGGGGGGAVDGDGPFESGEATVVISGRAPAGGDVTILVDGIETDSASADDDGAFRFTFSDIASGVYTFGIFAEDAVGGRSGTFSTSFTVTGNRISNLSGVTISPTVNIAPDPADVGETVAVTGSTFPNANVTLEHQRQGTAVSRQTFTATADTNGDWRINIDTNGFRQDTYELRVQADDGTLGGKTGFSQFFQYGVGQAARVQLDADLNRDGRVNLTDFSILLFWWGTAGGDSNPPADINRDGSVSLTDFSILLFNWTG